jgi:DNA-binding PadR family transcriptional regulator
MGSSAATRSPAPGKLSRLEHVVLGVLANGPRHAYSLKQRLGPGLAARHQINDGVLYPLLARLERRGLVTGSEEPGERGRARRVYAVTDAGRETFLAWLRGPRDEGDDLSYDLFIAQPLVKLFFVGSLTARERGEKLASLAAAARTRLAALEAIEREPPPEGWSDVGRALLDLSLDQQRATIAALERLAAT